MLIRFIGKCPDGRSLTFGTHVPEDVILHLVNTLYDKDTDPAEGGYAKKTKSLINFQRLFAQRGTVINTVVISHEREFGDFEREPDGIDPSCILPANVLY